MIPARAALLFALLVPTAPLAEHGTLVVLNKSDADVSLIDPSSGTTLARIAVGRGPHEAAASPDGKLVVVCNYGRRAPGSSLSVIDVDTRAVVRTIDLGHHRPHGVQFTPDGKRCVVTAESEKKLLVVDPLAGEVVAAIDTDQGLSHMVALDRAGERAFVANIRSGTVTVIDLEKREPVAVIATGRGAEGIAAHPVRDEVWVTNRSADTVSVIDTVGLEVRHEMDCGSFPIRIAFTPDGEHALISCARSGDLAVLKAKTRELVRRISMKEQMLPAKERERRAFGGKRESPMPIGILVEPGGRRAYVANTNADAVSVVDLQHWKVVRRIATGHEPDGMAWVVCSERGR